MNAADIQQLVTRLLQGLASSTVFVLVLFIGFCVVVGLTKLKKTAGGTAMVIKSLDERLTRTADGLPDADRPERPGRPAQDRGTHGGSCP